MKNNDHDFAGVNQVISSTGDGRVRHLLVPKYPGAAAAVNAARWSHQILDPRRLTSIAMRSFMTAYVVYTLYLCLFAWESVSNWMVTLAGLFVAFLVSDWRTARLAHGASDSYVFKSRARFLPGAEKHNAALEAYIETLSWLSTAVHKGAISRKEEALLAETVRSDLYGSNKLSQATSLTFARDQLVSRIEGMGLNTNEPVPSP